MSPRVKKTLLAAAFVVAALAFPQVMTSNYWLQLLNLAASFSVACLGLNILLGYSGQLSLAQAAFWGIGAYTSALLTTKLGVPVWGGMIAAFLVAAAFGVLLGIPSLKLSGHYLAVTTIGFGIILQLVLINWISFTGGADGITQIPPLTLGPFALNDAASFFPFAFLSLAALAWASMRMKDSRVGRALLAIRENEMAAETVGIDTTFYKIMAFAMCAGYAGFAGSLFAHSGSNYISPDTFSFEQSVLFLAMAVLGGNGSAVGAIVGATLLSLLPEVLRFLKDSYMMFYAAGIVAVMVFMPGGIANLVQGLPVAARARARWTAAFAPAPAARILPAALSMSDKLPPAPVANRRDGETLLVVSGLAKHFGGLKAVDGVDMEVRAGDIHALIGPNGSGKTTILNMLSGLYVPTAGLITFGGESVGGLRPHDIAARGIARTFQNIRLFSDLTVLENVMIGRHVRARAGLASSVARPPAQRAEEQTLRETAREVLRFVGLSGKEDAQARSLPYGRQRLAEVARALASDPKLLLLDEPAAGLNAAETERLMDLLFQIRDRGVTILLVEHDMNLVMNVSDRLTCINFGKKIAEGSGSEIACDPEVIDAYLGREAANA